VISLRGNQLTTLTVSEGPSNLSYLDVYLALSLPLYPLREKGTEIAPGFRICDCA